MSWELNVWVRLPHASTTCADLTEVAEERARHKANPIDIFGEREGQPERTKEPYTPRTLVFGFLGHDVDVHRGRLSKKAMDG